MIDYFLRRLLLTIPTFIGCTIVVFTIVQLAPGGPLEQQIMAMKMGSSGVGGEGGGSGGLKSDGASIPESALEELREYYGFDEPLHWRYLMWLGVYPRKTDYYTVQIGEVRNVGEGKHVVVEQTGTTYRVVDAENRTQEAGEWFVQEKTTMAGEKKIRVYRKEFSGILTGNFGRSYEYRDPVIDLIIERLPISTQFGIIGLILSYTVCVYLGIRKALEHGTPFDLISSFIVFIGYSIPGWALGALALVLLGGGSFWDVFPLGGFQSRDYEALSFFGKILDRAYHGVLPAIAYTIGSFATLTVLMKNSILDNLSQDYVRTAFAKGLRERRVIWLHTMRNSIIPVSARLGFIIGVFLAGSYFIELVFNIDGVGRLAFQAILTRDYPIVFAFTVINVMIMLIGAILSDFILAMVDPRIRFK